MNGLFGSFIEQGITSLGSFIYLAIVARLLPADSFGIFGLLMTSALFLQSLHLSGVLTPSTMLLSSLDAVGQQEAMRVMRRWHRIGELAATGIAVLLAICGWWLAGLFILALGLRLAYELERRCGYATARVWRSAALSLIANGLPFAGLAVVWVAGVASPAWCFAPFILTGVATLGSRWWYAADPVVDGVAPVVTYRTSLWPAARWLLPSTLFMWVSGLIFPYLLGWLATLTLAGYFTAMRNLLNMPNVVIQGSESYFLPTLRRLRATGDLVAARRHEWQLIVGFTTVGILLLAGCGLAPGFIMKLAFGETLLPAAKYLPWFAAATTLLLVYRAFATVLLSRNLPQAGLYGYAVGALLSVVASYPAISWWGLAGAVTLVVVNNLILVSCAVVIFWRRPSDLASSIPSAVS